MVSYEIIIYDFVDSRLTVMYNAFEDTGTYIYYFRLGQS